MCESTIIIDDGENLEEVMKDVVKVHIENDVITCLDLTGEMKQFTDHVVFQIDSLKHSITLKKK